MEYSDKLLDAWINLSTTLRNERFVESMTFNEIILLRFLKQQQESNLDSPYLSIKELCDKTKMYKSAMNRVLNDLENKKYIERMRFSTNRKNVYIKLTKIALENYETEHAKINDIVDKVINYLGEEDIEMLISNLNKISEITEKIWLNKRKENNNGN